MLPIALVVAGAAVFFLVRGRASRSGSIAIDKAVQLDRDTVLLVGNSGRDTDVRRTGRLILMAADGTVRTRIDHEGAFALLGIADDVLWIDNPKLGVHARRVDDLSVVEGSRGDFNQHPALKASARALGMADGKVVLEGADRFLYTLAPDGSIEKKSKDLKYARRHSPESLGRADDPLPDGCAPPGDGARTLMKTLEAQMSTPVLVACGRGHGIVALDDPEGHLVLHTAFDASGQIWQLSRVVLGAEVEIAWSVGDPAMVAAAPFEEDGATTVPWVGLVGGELRALVESESFHRSTDYRERTTDYTIVEHRLVRIDPASGAVLGATPVVVPEA